METIMLCLNQLGIGGVETAVLNQTIQLKRMGYQVIILAKNGIYKEQFEKEGAIIIDFEFKVQNYIDTEKINKVIEIIKKYKINQVHIHQFDCINVIFPACVYTNIPYIAYAHTGIKGVYNWFENSFEIYKILFKMYFESAKKIITITEDAKKENQEKYKIDDEKYIVINNSIDFERFCINDNKIPLKIEKFLILSRLGKEKLISLKNSINIFKEYLKINNNAVLTIAGDGECKKEVEECVNEIKENVILLGEIRNVSEVIYQNDIVMGVDRCILETIAIKRIALISGYESIKGIVIPQNIEEASNSNFSARNFKDLNVNEAVKQIEDLNKMKINEIVNSNYEFAYKKLNINNNTFVLKNNSEYNNIYKIDYFMNCIIESQNLCDEKNKIIENNWKECVEAKKWYEEQIKNREADLKNKMEIISEQEKNIGILNNKIKEQEAYIKENIQH